MRNLILILIIFMTFLMVLKKDLPSKFIKNSFDKKISKIQVNNLKNLSPSIILNSIYLKERRKYVVVIIFIFAAILTPPDPITQIGLALPLLLLYELSILTVKFIEKKDNV